MRVVAVLAAMLICGAAHAQRSGKAVQPNAAALQKSMAAGKVVYEANCLTCHQADGSGVPSLNPPLYGTTWITGPPKRMIQLVLKGMSGQEIDGQRYHNTMPAHDFLTDRQVADLLTYVRRSFGNKAAAVTVAEVKLVRAEK